MSARRNESTSTADREIVLTRVFDAPRELVWKAWTDPDHVQHWWGPTGFTTKTEEMDVRPGGTWTFVMRGPDGHEYPNRITYLEVLAPERLTYEHGGGEDVEPVRFQATVTFEEEDGTRRQTKVTLRSIFPSGQAREFVIREYNAVEGGKQTLARLGEYLEQSSSTERPFVISRVFDAPRDLVFRMWTKRDHLERWFGPQGCTIPVCTLDLRTGGTFHYCMRFPNAHEMWGKWVFREIVEPERLVFVSSFSDPAGNVVHEPSHAEWPLELLATVTFDEHAGIGGGTVVTLRWFPLNATPAERQVFEDGRASMKQGWTGTLDQLAKHLTEA